MPMKLSELLRRGWTRGCAARDAQGSPISSLSDEARTYCFWGAYLKINSGNAAGIDQINKLRQELFPLSVWLSIPLWNDTVSTTHDQIIQLAEEAERRGIIRYDAPVQS